MTAVLASAAETSFSQGVGPQVWRGPDMAERSEEWIYEMNAADNADLKAATAAAMATGKDILEIEADDFPLPHFGA